MLLAMVRRLLSRAAKRALDVVGAGAALALTAPVMAVTAVAVARELGRPVLFRQVRPGLHGAPFTMFKFRTMRDATDAHGRALPDAERLTSLGRFLRASSLDELPELWNVLRGDMSLVGPRPLLMQYLPLYSREQARRHDVKPGITGWAQIHGRNALSWDEKFALDLWYVDHASLWLDLRILAGTVRAVLRKDGISHAGDATMPVFTGPRPSPGALLN
jgi:lipopolysaccharide/colanic/teichoic acid biosynthesis glycosyltransferase